MDTNATTILDITDNQTVSRQQRHGATNRRAMLWRLVVACTIVLGLATASAGAASAKETIVSSKKMSRERALAMCIEIGGTFIDIGGGVSQCNHAGGVIVCNGTECVFFDVLGRDVRNETVVAPGRGESVADTGNGPVGGHVVPTAGVGAVETPDAGVVTAEDQATTGRLIVVADDEQP